MLTILILLSCLNNDLATVGCPDKKRKDFCPNGERETSHGDVIPQKQANAELSKVHS